MERFVIKKSQTHSNWWVCTNTENGIVCIFENGKFNETQQFTILDDIKQPDANQLALVVREMADWLCENHYKKAML